MSQTRLLSRKWIRQYLVHLGILGGIALVLYMYQPKGIYQIISDLRHTYLPKRAGDGT